MRISILLKFGFLFLIFFSGNTRDNYSSINCDNFEVAYTLKQTLDTNQIEITLQVKGGSQPYYYLFFDKNNDLLNWQFDRNSIQVNKGEIQKVKVTDATGCIKELHFNESGIK